MFSKYFFFRDEFLLFHLMNLNTDYIQKFINSKRNKDKARRYIIYLKYQLSAISPLVYDTIKDSADKFCDNTKEDSGGFVTFTGGESGSFLGSHVVFKLPNYKLIMTMREFKLRFYYCQAPCYYSSRWTNIGLSRLEKRLMYFLSWYKLDNKSKIETFKNNKEYDKIINRR